MKKILELNKKLKYVFFFFTSDGHLITSSKTFTTFSNPGISSTVNN